jgi:hypothetical protein
VDAGDEEDAASWEPEQPVHARAKTRRGRATRRPHATREGQEEKRGMAVVWNQKSAGSVDWLPKKKIARYDKLCKSALKTCHQT